ncbi:MAG: pyridoxal-phosphate-dependent aminotransferase family protein [Chloroflexia bacterium]
MQLRIPGPTPLPDEVLEAMNRDMISHRGPEFRAILREVTAGLKHCFQTEGDVLIFPAAGTGGLEAAIANLFSAGDKVITMPVGAFGERFAEIATRFGLEVLPVASPWGEAADIPALEQALAENPGAKGILATHNETSTGVENNMEAAGRLARAHDVLLVVDAISSMGAVDIPVDRWGIDVAVTASQKAWMAPPGLTMLSVSERAWRANTTARLPRFYWDFAEARRFLERGETPYTPAVSLLYGLQASLRLIMAEGLNNVFARHERVRDLLRAGAAEIGYRPFARDAIASRTVTALYAPEGLSAREIVAAMRERGIVLAGGQGAYEHTALRVGHMGFVTEADIEEVLQHLAAVVNNCSPGPMWAAGLEVRP